MSFIGKGDNIKGWKFADLFGKKSRLQSAKIMLIYFIRSFITFDWCQYHITVFGYIWLEITHGSLSIICAYQPLKDSQSKDLELIYSLDTITIIPS